MFCEPRYCESYRPKTKNLREKSTRGEQAPCSIFSENCYTVDLFYSHFQTTFGTKFIEIGAKKSVLALGAYYTDYM